MPCARAVPSAVSSELWWAPIWARHRSRYEAAGLVPAAGERVLRRELIFCLLGGHGVPYELARSATNAVQALQPFAPSWTEPRLRRAIRCELVQPQFEPPRANGTLRRYRFPERKAALIADAVMWVRSEGGLHGGLDARATEAERRRWLNNCPGLAMKSASWLLRNCGWARRLAIIDVHLLRALVEAHVVVDPILPRDYEAVEDAYLRWADELGACPAALDRFLWDVQRSR